LVFKIWQVRIVPRVNKNQINPTSNLPVVLKVREFVAGIFDSVYSDSKSFVT
jgi:hypothetical protein